MKKFTKVLTLALAAVLVTALCLFTASCGKTVEYTFETNGAAAVESVVINDGEEYTLPVITRDGYSFEGWYRSADFSGDAVTTVVGAKADKKAENTTFYAKWEKLYKVTLNADGGSLSVNSVYLKKGANVYEAVKDIVPTKNGLVFGAWYNGQKELNKNLKMTEDDLTLTAKYQVKYTVEFWCETDDQTYEKKNSIEKYDYVGATVVSEETLDGFEEITLDDSVVEGTLTANADENVFRHYFNRCVYTVTFRPNYPDGTTGKVVSVPVKYEQGIAVPYQYEFEGYCFVGWSETPNGKVKYYADYISTVLFNKGEEVAADPDVVYPTRDMSLYAVWSKGYADMFGGSDYIYLFDEDSKVIYLNRGGIFFKGEYNPESKKFLFVDEKDNILLEGKLTELNYLYLNEARATYSASRYVVGSGVDENVKIYLDAYDGITYSLLFYDMFTGATSSIDMKGTYTLDENGYYTAVFPEKTIKFVLGTVTVGGTKVNVFQERNEEEVALGELPRFGVYQGQLTTYIIGQITLNGFNIATYKTGMNSDGSDAYTYYYYILEDDVLTLYNGSWQTQGSFLIKEYNGDLGYVYYDKNTEITATGENGETLTLDGIFEATYVKGEEVINAYYTCTTSVYGDYIVTFKDGATAYTLLVTSETVTETVPDTDILGNPIETTKQVVKYYLTEKPEGYQEYLYVNVNDKGSPVIFNYPLIIFNDQEKDKASIYGYNSDKEYVLIATGSYTYNESTKRYTIVIKDRFEVEDLVELGFDINGVSDFEFYINTELSDYAFFYVYSSTPLEGDVDIQTDVYTSEKGGTLTFIAGLIEYSEEGKYWVSTYQASENMILANNTYFEIDEETKTFITLNPSPYVAYALSEDGYGNQNEYIYFDGKGGAIYTVVSTDPETGNKSYDEDPGMFVYTGRKTENGVEIYAFTSETRSFNYILLYTSSYVFFSPENLNYNGEYISDDGALVLDGYGYIGSYTDPDGNNYLGFYFIPEENVVCVIINGGYRYFDIKDGKTFTARGTEYGTYLIRDNLYSDDYYATLNGYGKATVFTYEKDEDGKYKKDADGNYVQSVVDGQGTYVFNNDGTVTLTYKNGTESITLNGAFDTYVTTNGTLRLFEVVYKNIATTYVNTKDWSIIILDSHGGAVKYNTKGVMEKGSYTIITENLFYYLNDAQTDAAIYNYNTDTYTAIPVKLDPFGYYTQELDSLLFSEYGFAIFNGVDYYYYEIIDGQAYIYVRDIDNPQANEYGFVAQLFGEFTDTKVWENKTYLKASGYALDFKREANEESYPLVSTGIKNGEPATESIKITTLTFAPSGKATFSVKGTVVLESTLTVGDDDPVVTTQNYSCTVTRLYDENNVARMYVTVGYYQFEIDTTYIGEREDYGTEFYNGTYSVKGLKYILSADSDFYYNYYFIAALFGIKLDNGNVTFTTTFDTDGNIVSMTATGSFGTSSGMYDKNGQLISFEDADFTIDGSTYIVSFTGEDGSAFKGYFNIVTNSSYNVPAYQLIALTRVQTLTDEDSGITVEVERIVASEAYSAGSVFSISVVDPEVELTQWYTYDGKIYYINREKADGVITKTTYYVISLTEETVDSELGSEATVKAVMPYASVKISASVAETIYVEDSNSYADIVDGEVRVIYLDGENYIGIETTYDENTNTYTAKISTTKGFTVKVVTTEGGTKNVVIKSITIEEPSEEPTDEEGSNEDA